MNKVYYETTTTHRREGKNIIETSTKKVFQSAKHAADHFGLRYSDVRQFCQYRESGYVINGMANQRVKEKGLDFEFYSLYVEKQKAASQQSNSIVEKGEANDAVAAG